MISRIRFSKMSDKAERVEESGRPTGEGRLDSHCRDRRSCVTYNRLLERFYHPCRNSAYSLHSVRRHTAIAMSAVFVVFGVFCIVFGIHFQRTASSSRVPRPLANDLPFNFKRPSGRLKFAVSSSCMRHRRLISLFHFLIRQSSLRECSRSHANHHVAAITPRPSTSPTHLH